MGLHQGRITIDQARAFVLAVSAGSYAQSAAESSATAAPLR